MENRESRGGIACVRENESVGGGGSGGDGGKIVAVLENDCVGAGDRGGGAVESQATAEETLPKDSNLKNEELCATDCCSESGEEVADDACVLVEEYAGGDGGHVEGQTTKETFPMDSTRKNEVLYAVHRDQFLKLLSEDAWRYFLGTLMDSPEDLENCANSSPYSWELVQDQRCSFLFPKVINIMASFYEEQSVNCRKITSETDTKTMLNLPHVVLRSDKKWRTAVLNCRLTCSSWNKAVEHCYQQPEMTGIPAFVKELNPTSRLHNLYIIDWTKENTLMWKVKPEDTVNQFESTHHFGIGGALPKNPFIGRYALFSIYVEYHEEHVYHERYNSELDKLLNMFGKHIWYCELEHNVNSTVYRNELFGQKLKGLLSLMPNLRSLRIHFSYVKPDEDTTVCPDLPKMEKLESLDLKKVPTSIASQLVRVNNHVKYLTLEHTECDEELGTSLVNLQRFVATGSGFGRRMMEACGSNWKKLTSLYLVTKMDPGSAFMGAEMTFKLFQNNWSNTLTELNIHFPFWGQADEEAPQVFEESRLLRLELPCVRTLFVAAFGWIFLDFALPMKNCLEHLKIVMGASPDYPQFNEPRERVMKEQSVELVGFEDKMNESNIWTTFGKLKTVKWMRSTEQWIVYTKEDMFVYWKKFVMPNLLMSFYNL